MPPEPAPLEPLVLDGRGGGFSVSVRSRPALVPGQDDFLVEPGTERLRIAVIDGATPIQTTPTIAGVSGAIWAASIVRAALRNVGTPIEECLKAANAHLFEAFGALPARARPQASVVACDITAAGLEFAQAGDCTAWVADPSWACVLDAEMLTGAGRKWFEALLERTSTAEDEQPLYEDIDNWTTTPVGLFSDLVLRRAERTAWRSAALGSDGALVDATALADLPGWEDHVDAMEKAAGSHPRRRKVRDDATLVVVEHDRR